MSARSSRSGIARADAAPPPVGSVVPVATLDGDERRQLLALMRSHFRDVTEARFAADLADKEVAVLLRRAGEIVGFSTLARSDDRFAGEGVTAFFSGDTIVRRDARASADLARVWARHVFAEADRLRRAEPRRRVVWLLISSGYKTYRFLPLFFRDYLPAPGRDAAPADLALLRQLAAGRFGSRFDPASGIVRLAHPTPLRDGVADVTAPRLRDPHVAHFVGANPDHAAGDELVCLADLHPDNVTAAGRRMLGLDRGGLRTGAPGGGSASGAPDRA